MADREQLALDIVHQELGEMNGHVCRVLVTSGPLVLHDLVEACRKPTKGSDMSLSGLEVQSCLLALVCHDIVVPRAMLSPRARKRATATKRAPTDESVKVIGVLYEGHFIARELLLYGHRTREQVIEEAFRLVESIEKGEADATAGLGPSSLYRRESFEGLAEANVEKVWDRMVQERYVVRSRALALPRRLLAGDEGGMPTALPADWVTGDEVTRGSARQAASSAASSSKLGNKAADMLRDVSDTSTPRHATASGSSSSLLSARRSRKRATPDGGRDGNDDDVDDSALDGSGNNGSATATVSHSSSLELWQFSASTVEDDMLDECMIRYVEERLSRRAGLVVRTMRQLERERGGGMSIADRMEAEEAARAAGGEDDETQSGSTGLLGGQGWISARAVTQRLKQEQGSNAPKWQDVQLVMRLMEGPPYKFLHKQASGAHGGVYEVAVTHIVRLMRLRVVESMVENKFGVETARVLRLLLRRGMLEERHVGEFAMVTPREARSMLYSLYQSGFVRMYQVPKRANHEPSTTTFLWHAYVPELDRLARSSICKAIFNMRIRRQVEHGRHEQVASSRDHVPASTGSSLETERLQLEQAIDKLDSAVQHLDESLALF